MSNIRIDEPLKNGKCKECTHCLQIKRTLKCDAIRKDKYISCREVRVCGDWNKIKYGGSV